MRQHPTEAGEDCALSDTEQEAGCSTRRIGVVVVHGVGITKADWHLPLVNNTYWWLSHLSGINRDDLQAQFVFAPATWTDLIQPIQDSLWHNMMKARAGSVFAPSTLRRFLLDYAADAVVYERSADSAQSNHYQRVHDRLRQALATLAKELGPDAPVVFVAHSLGCVVASNFLWDLQKAPVGDTPLQRGETLAAMMTLGCPLAFWAMRFPNFGAPIQVPSPLWAVQDPVVSEGCWWLNLYDARDVIGMPLRPLGPHYERVVREDRMISTNAPISSSTPLAHADFLYWRSGDVGDGLARLLLKLAGTSVQENRSVWNTLRNAARSAQVAFTGELEVLRMIASAYTRAREQGPAGGRWDVRTGS